MRAFLATQDLQETQIFAKVETVEVSGYLDHTKTEVTSAPWLIFISLTLQLF